MERYKEYKDSGNQWIGEIPSHWGTRQLKKLLKNPLKYGANEQAEIKNIDYPRYIRITDINDNGSLKKSTWKSLNPSKAKDYLLNKGDVLFARSGATVGKTYLFNEDYPSCFAGYLIKATCSSLLLPKFLLYFTKSGTYENWKNSIFIQSTIQNIGADKYGALSIPLPPLSEQQRIVDFLEDKTKKIDQYIAEKEKQLQLLEEYKQSLIANAVTKGLNPDVKMKDSGIPWIGMIPEHWEVRQLRKYLRLVSVKNHPDALLLSVVREQGVIVRNTESKEENHNFIPEDLSNYKYVQKGQFVINKMKSWQGSYGVSDYDGIVSPAYYVCDLNFNLKKFFNSAIRSKFYVPFFTQYSKGIRVDQWDLSTIGLKNIPFIEPPIEEQRAIVSYIEEKCSKVDSLISDLETEISHIKEYKQRLIADCVTGQIKV